MNQELHLLVVEDQPVIQQIHITSLSRLGCRVTLAMNGEETQAYLLPKISMPLLYHALLLDLGLPDVTGIELCRGLRQFYSPEQLPIIAVTAFGDEKKAECFSAGMQAFYTKPLSSEMYSEIVNKYCSLHKNQRSSIRSISF